MPAFLYSDAALSSVARGITWSRPENMVGSLRISVAWIHATGLLERFATRSLANTIAQAPSDDGQVSR